jgi:hypothetical protein
MITAAVAAEAKSARRAAKYAQDQEKEEASPEAITEASKGRSKASDQEKAVEVDTAERDPKKADETLTKAAEEALEATYFLTKLGISYDAFL